MSMRLSTMLMTGTFMAALVAVSILPAGCQSSNQTAMAKPAATGTVCPICGVETHKAPITGLKFTTCVCPRCKQVSKIDPETLQKIEDVFGYMPDLRVDVCEGCGAIVRECASCRQAESSQKPK